MKTIYMDITDPDWIYADDAIRRWKAEGNPSMVTYWEGVKARSLKLRDEIIETVELEGSCKLSWYSGNVYMRSMLDNGKNLCQSINLR